MYTSNFRNTISSSQNPSNIHVEITGTYIFTISPSNSPLQQTPLRNLLSALNPSFIRTQTAKDDQSPRENKKVYDIFTLEPTRKNEGEKKSLTNNTLSFAYTKDKRK